MKYKIWVHIEEIDEEQSHYHDIEDEVESIGEEFDTLEAAIEAKDRMILDFLNPLYKML